MVRIIINNAIDLVNFKHDLISAYDRKISRLYNGLRYIKKDLINLRRRACDIIVNNNRSEAMRANLDGELLQTLERYHIIVSEIAKLDRKRRKEVIKSLIHYCRNYYSLISYFEE